MVFTDIYHGYRPITLDIVNNYGFRTDICSYWSITVVFGITVLTASDIYSYSVSTVTGKARDDRACDFTEHVIFFSGMSPYTSYERG